MIDPKIAEILLDFSIPSLAVALTAKCAVMVQRKQYLWEIQYQEYKNICETLIDLRFSFDEMNFKENYQETEEKLTVAEKKLEKIQQMSFISLSKNMSIIGKIRHKLFELIYFSPQLENRYKVRQASYALIEDFVAFSFNARKILKIKTKINFIGNKPSPFL